MQSPKYVTFEFLTLLDKISLAASSSSKSVTAYVPCKLPKFLNQEMNLFFYFWLFFIWSILGWYFISTFFFVEISFWVFFEGNSSFYVLIVSVWFTCSVSSCAMKYFRNQQFRIYRPFLRNLEQKLIRIFGLVQSGKVNKSARYFFLNLHNFRVW